jgi:NAD(P)-dependent dehydrogenase (short-subunit alcohol dehydrogenase family)
VIALGGKVCVITGGLGLIGGALVRAFARAGGRVVITDLDHAACVERARGLGRDALGHGADITKRESLAALLAAVLDRHDRLDVLVNCAAIDDKLGASAARDSAFEHYPLERWQHVLDANITGTFLACQVLGSAMLAGPRRDRSIINVASIYGVVAPDQALYRTPDGAQPFFKAASYPTSKAAVLGFTRYLAAYWGAAGIRVNALTPGGVEAGQPDHFVERYAARTPLGRMATADDYGGPAVFLASDDASYLTGSNLVVDGGFTAW